MTRAAAKWSLGTLGQVWVASIRRGGTWRWSVTKPVSLPPGAKLIVQHRAPYPSFHPGTPVTERAAAIKALEIANSALAFRTLLEIDGNGNWSGMVTEPGALRLCMTGGPALLVHSALLAPER